MKDSLPGGIANGNESRSQVELPMGTSLAPRQIMMPENETFVTRDVRDVAYLVPKLETIARNYFLSAKTCRLTRTTFFAVSLPRCGLCRRFFSDRIIQVAGAAATTMRLCRFQSVLEKSHDGPLQLVECLARDIKVLLEVASLLKKNHT